MERRKIHTAQLQALRVSHRRPIAWWPQELPAHLTVALPLLEATRMTTLIGDGHAV